MPNFYDLSVMPSYLESKQMGFPGESTLFSSVQLLQGEVKEKILPTDSRSQSQKYIEYAVDIEYRKGSGAITVTRFPNCLLVNQFGGVGDRTTYTLRPDSKAPEGDSTFTTGSKVLVMCVNGDVSHAYIIGGIREDGDKDSESGHHLHFEFNGVQAKINDDGELTITYRGKTQVDGSLDSSADTEAEGSTIKFSKDGTIYLYTKDEAEGVKISHPDRRIYTTSEAGLHVGKATDETMLGTTYRNAENKMHETLKEKLKAIQSKLNDAASNLSIAGSFDSWMAVSGPMITAGNLSSAGSSLSGAASLAGEMADAIDKFESDKEKYLSKINKND